MRARYLNAWPALSHHYGLHPWDVDRLSYAEINAYAEALNEMAREQKKQQRTRAGRRR